MTDASIGTPEQLRDPNFTPALHKAIPLGIQHVLAMFVSNVTPAIIISSVAGIAFGPNADPEARVYLLQMAMMFAGVATLFQTIGLGPVGARLPIVQGTSFAFLPVMIPAMIGAGTAGLAGLMTGVVIGGLFHAFLGLFVGRIRFALPPLVTGLIVLMIGLALVKVGIEYAAGGAGDFNRGKPTWGGMSNWFQAGVVLFVTLALKFFARGMLSVSAVLIGLIAGYIVAYLMGDVNLAGMGDAAWVSLPQPFKFGFAFNPAIIIGMCLMAFISAIETVGDVSGITKGGAGREATDAEVTGATYADGLGSALAGVFGSLPNTSFSQNVGLIAMTGVMSRHVVTIGAVFLIACGLVPKVGAIISTVPIQVLGGGVIVMFGMVAAAGVSMLSDVNWNSRNMIIFAVALSVGLGLQQVPDAFNIFFKFDDAGAFLLNGGGGKIPNTFGILMTSGLLPAAFIAILLNLLLPTTIGDEAEAELAGAVKGIKENSNKA